MLGAADAAFLGQPTVAARESLPADDTTLTEHGVRGGAGHAVIENDSDDDAEPARVIE